MIKAFIILIIIVVIIKTICEIVKRCFDDNYTDIKPCDKYALPAKGYYGNKLPVLATPCKHQGKKSTVTEWTSVNCEKTYTYCLECFERIDEGKIDCR